jgi:hypothetical protein
MAKEGPKNNLKIIVWKFKYRFHGQPTVHHHAEYAFQWNCPHAEHFTSLDLEFPSPVVHIFNIVYGQFIHYHNFADVKIWYI